MVKDLFQIAQSKSIYLIADLQALLSPGLNHEEVNKPSPKQESEPKTPIDEDNGESRVSL